MIVFFVIEVVLEYGWLFLFECEFFLFVGCIDDVYVFIFVVLYDCCFDVW